ncbi:hypothetical protein [Longimicrobium sp.]|uniref:hypothetical protein n=1 Tax=Longimicrobium sp. TaxID=2029185 RepID=UPI002EDA8BB8
MTPAEQRKRFIASVQAQIRRRGLQRDDGVLRVLGTLIELQARTRASLEALPSEFDAARLPGFLTEIDGHVAKWRDRALGVMDTVLEQAFELGPQMVDAPLKAAGISVRLPMIPESLLEEVKDYTAKRITGVSELARTRIGDHVRLTVLGGKSPHEAMKAIGEEVDGPGPFRYVSFRAETITRTEMGNLHSAAGQRRLEAAAEVVPGMKKQWLWSGKGRAMHASITGQIREVKEAFEMPDGAKLQHPRDPAGGVEHVANCGCESVPYMEHWGKQ